MGFVNRAAVALAFAVILGLATHFAYERGWNERVASEAKIEADVSAFMRDIGTCEALHSIAVANQCHPSLIGAHQ